jgi:steroid 5-alpha reductase family enzyme
VKARLLWCTLFTVCVSTLVFVGPTRDFALCNALVQAVIFLAGAHLPAWRNNRLSYVDFAWPAGVAAIGVALLAFAHGHTLLTIAVAAIHVLVGSRMAIWAAHMYRPGVLTRDLPRYEYQRQRWARAGFRSERFSVQYEIAVQGMANMSFLAVPALLVAADPRPAFTAWHAAWILVWIAAFALESIADLQKRRYAGADLAHRKGVCDVGLWRYSRHPNYFGQWLQWIALVALAAPSLWSLRDDLPIVAVVILALSLAWVVYLMYSTLVYYTGAVPAEHFSRLKRPAYADYQATVNRFVPGPRRVASARTMAD